MLSRFHRNNGRIVAILSSFLVCVAITMPASGQGQRPNNPFQPFSPADLEAFFKNPFGPEGNDAESEETRAAVEKMQVSAREERRIGQSAVNAYLAGVKQRAKVTDRGRDVEYLQKLVSTLQPMMKNARRYRSIRVYLVNSDETDARSFPGGSLVFFRGILDLAENEAALVGVVGHELSHLDRQHQLYDAKRMKLMQQTFSGEKGFSFDTFFKNGMMLSKSFTRPFRPQEEAEADGDAVRWAYAAGYDPREMSKLFVRLAKRNPATGVVPEFAKTHPNSADRVRATMELYDDLQRRTPMKELHIGKENLAKRIPKSVKRKF